jgi:hypothetical protein
MAETFGELMRDQMRELGLNQGDIVALMKAHHAPVHPNMVSRWACDRNAPTGERLAALLDILQIKRREDRAEACRLAARVPAEAQGEPGSESESDAA